ncbi:Pkinase-domain-containing protein [Stereum hirsutum FP-91666 SS1]|uniref:Pkinase-domain-containing protein n=1 Tax=Stereum hirsutum (strain FP-91666) TaxID=721885 RepID=UPI000440E293|nr:Pkinase-domain-containing protein [Stereum hirsutum FP-91666 SS1]EIM91316.1 Pkinase-domain-containing protein [Stereum hirsutum FP-91666 SS1]
MDSLPQPLLRALDHVRFEATNVLSMFTSCCTSQAKLKINGRTFKIVKILGEGGFSFVYLAQDEQSERQFALKKIRCPTGSEGVKEAMREVEAYRRFKHPNIIRILDSAVLQDPEGDGQIVYLFLPLYKRGNLQDAINNNLQTSSHFPERQMLRLFKGTCEAVRAMHTYCVSSSSSNSSAHPRPPSRGKSHSPGHDDDDDDHDGMLPHPEGDAEGGYSYGGPSAPSSTRGARGEPRARGEDRDGANVPLVSRERQEDGDVVFDGDEEIQHGEVGTGELVPYAHRDLKPGNVMLADDGVTPILMDFGSCMKARIPIENRSQALLQQDIAAEHSTMAYRAPELFDVKTGLTLDEKVDIWSLGCVLFALAYSHSPFENMQTTEQGGSIAMAVLNAQYKHPSSGYSAGFKALVDSMLKVNPTERPDINQVLDATNRLL